MYNHYLNSKLKEGTFNIEANLNFQLINYLNKL